MNKQGHLVNILSELLNGKTLSSMDIIASNSNQYFCNIKNNGIELIEIYEPNISNKGKHLKRSLKQEYNNIKKAKEYLARLVKKP